MIISFRIDDNTKRKLNTIQQIWNDKDAKIQDYEPYSISDVIRLCIGIIYEMETKLPKRDSVQ